MTVHQEKSLFTRFGDRVREARNALGMSQAELGERLAIERLQVGRWERGEGFIRPATLEKLAAVTGHPIAWFFQLDDEPLEEHTGPTLSHFGERMRAARQHLGVSQTDFGSVLGVEPLQVGRWEKGQSFPKPQKLEKIAEMIGKPVSWFFLQADADPLAAPGPRQHQAGPRVADDRPKVHLIEDIFTLSGPLFEGILAELQANPSWSEEGASRHQGQMLERARKRLGVNQELMAEQVLGWTKRRLSQIEKGERPSASEMAHYLGVLGISLDPPAWNAPTRLTGLSSEMVPNDAGDPVWQKVTYPTKVDPKAWCPTCELYQLLYPNFRCHRHKDTDWELEDALRELEDARKRVHQAEKKLARLLKARGVTGPQR